MCTRASPVLGEGLLRARGAFDRFRDPRGRRIAEVALDDPTKDTGGSCHRFRYGGSFDLKPASIVLSQVVNDRTDDSPVAATLVQVVAKTASTMGSMTIPPLSRPREPSIEESFFLQHQGLTRCRLEGSYPSEEPVTIRKLGRLRPPHSASRRNGAPRLLGVASP